MVVSDCDLLENLWLRNVGFSSGCIQAEEVVASQMGTSEDVLSIVSCHIVSPRHHAASHTLAL
jgi:hypothetical protein